MTWQAVKRDFRLNWQIYVLAIPIIIYYIVFSYVPMAGVVMAFQRFNPKLGYFKSPWIGLDNFKDYFGSYYFWRLIRNTFLISATSLVFSFPMPIIFALLLNEVKNRYFKKTVQTISYMPHFISMVVIAGLIKDFTDSDGLITMIVVSLGGEQRNLLSEPGLFRAIYVGSEVWQGVGFGSIIYLSALSNVDQELYEAATIDGAGRWKQTLHITIPGIASTIIIMLILRMGSLFSVGFEKIILLYSPMTYETSDVISSFVYRKGLLEMNYGYSTAVGLFNSIINFTMLNIANFISRKYSETSLF